MKISNSIPTEPGFYWHRDIDEGSGEAFEWEVLRLYRHDAESNELCAHGRGPAKLSFFGGEWGPRIPDPEELQEKAEADAALGEAIKRSIQKGHDMTRDKMAERFLVGILASVEIRSDEEERHVSLAYRYADAMIAERKRNAD